MLTYKLQLKMLDPINLIYGEPNGAYRSDGWFIPFDPANTDYQNFKKQINADEAQLENADGVLMTADEAKEYVKSLP